MDYGNYEEVAHYTLDPARQEDLLKRQNECTFIWSTKAGWPVGVIMSYVWRDGKIWLTASRQRPRVSAVQRDDRACVVVSSAGLPGTSALAITLKGRCKVLNDAKTKQWFYPALAKALIPDDPARQKGFVKMLDSPRRIVMCVMPEDSITFDGDKMAADTGGTLGTPAAEK